MAKANLTAAQRRAVELVDRIEGVVQCIGDATKSLDLATRDGTRDQASAAAQIKWARICMYDAITLLRASLPAGRSAEIKDAMRCLDTALTAMAP